MNYNPLSPFSTFRGGEVNAADVQFMQEQEEAERRDAIESAIAYFITLSGDDVDINDSVVQRTVFRRYGLRDLTNEEKIYISTQVEEGLN